MPVYEYRCAECRHTFEQYQSVGEPAPACPVCGSPSRKVYASVGLIFKGSGFHITDYRKAASPNGEQPPTGRQPSGSEAPAPVASSAGTKTS
ncbi:MAG: zinc ribbon domain-containing protein [Armatimonadota bacterium]|nr:zinc ribbon domain-containing protein [Armatimonadota bacterium]